MEYEADSEALTFCPKLCPNMIFYSTISSTILFFWGGGVFLGPLLLHIVFVFAETEMRLSFKLAFAFALSAFVLFLTVSALVKWK